MTYTGYPLALQFSPGMGIHVSLVQLFHSTLMGSLVWKLSFGHAFCTSVHLAALYVGWPLWHTAPGGVGLKRRPPVVSLSLAQESADGQPGAPGVVLHDGVSRGRTNAEIRAAERTKRYRKGDTMLWLCAE